ncbi:hypothetical protein F5984_16760 [Rudanella paleaurantiibacter]|uniref:Ig-like domain-containing protein n=1 Tax=Rudanella paleaurantiibacter TaxID=2614655 RepID=A0A7J5TXH9_9BACT|nr:immunoglobulin domain-containing protein [Rudanella paleaurantiibacter]KAB7729281.1 hypothetical protein F5984_16760 [Rudanella paleaurantiibacter]
MQSLGGTITNTAPGSFSNTGTIIENSGGNSSISFNGGLIQNNNGGSFTVTQGSLPLSVSATSATSCSAPNGSITLTGLQPNTAYTLSYTLNGTPTTLNPTSNGTGQVVVSGLSGGNYALILSGACVAQPLPLVTTIIGTPSALTITSQPATGSAVCAGGSLSLSVAVSGAATTYQWYKGGTLVSGQTTATLSLTNVQTTDAGSYSLVVTGGCNSVTSTAFNLTVNTGCPLVWTGATNTNWNTATNWSLNRVPTSTDNVIISPGPSNMPTLSTTAVANSVEVQAGASFSISSAGRLTINGSKAPVGVITTAFYNGGIVVNGGSLVLGNTGNVGQHGLWNNSASFSNVAGGSIQIDRSNERGLLNEGLNGSFVNSGSITIGANASVGQTGLWNTSSFSNLTGGSIQVDRSTLYGLGNNGSNASFVNSASIIIGALATPGQFGLGNGAPFSNAAGGSIRIDRSSIADLLNQGSIASFVNSATLTLSTSLNTAISNRVDAIFNNQGCAALIQSLGNAVISNSASFSNTGTIIENASGNSNISFNGGLVQNLNGGSFTVTSGSAPLSVSGTSPTTCNPANGSFTLAGLQPNTTYTLSYSASAGGNTTRTITADPTGRATVSELTGGNYTLLLGGACVAQALPLSVSLNSAGSPVAFTQQPGSGTAVCAGSSISVPVGVTGPVTAYQWYKDGQVLTGIASATTATLSLGNVQAANGGNYVVVATGICNSLTSTAYSLTVNAPNLSITASPSLTITPGQTVTLTATGAVSYTWTGGSTGNRFTVSPATTSTYSVTGVSAAGCSSSTSVTIVTGGCSSMVTVQNGPWNAPATWSCGRIPQTGDVLRLRHAVTLPAGFTGFGSQLIYEAGGQLITGSGSKLRLGTF